MERREAEAVAVQRDATIHDDVRLVRMDILHVDAGISPAPASASPPCGQSSSACSYFGAPSDRARRHTRLVEHLPTSPLGNSGV